MLLDSETTEPTRRYIVIRREFLFWLGAFIGAVAVILGLYYALGTQQLGILLLVAGLVLLAGALWQAERSRDWLRTIVMQVRQVSVTARIAGLGFVLLACGVVIRFTPRDLSTVFSVLGMGVLLIAFLLWLESLRQTELDNARAAVPDVEQARPMQRPAGARTGNNPPLSPAPDLREAEGGIDDIAEQFRLQVSETVFQHAKRTSLISMLLSLVLFVVGVAMITWLVYSIFNMQRSDDVLSNFVEQYVLMLANERGEAFTDLSTAFASSAPILIVGIRQVAAFVGLLFLIWIGSRLMFNAISLSQRRVLQETLAQLGPLQSILAGIPPRKPYLLVAEQSLQQARRSFVLRSFVSQAIFVVGLVLFIILALQGIINGWDDQLTTAVVGGAGIVSLIFAMVYERQAELQATLEEIVRLQREVASDAQVSEIVDEYTARLFQSDADLADIATVESAITLLTTVRAPADTETGPMRPRRPASICFVGQATAAAACRRRRRRKGGGRRLRPFFRLDAARFFAILCP